MLNYFSPVYGRSFASLPDWYFDLGQKAFIVSGSFKSGILEIKPYAHRSPFLVTALKVASYLTVVLPLLMLALKVVVRALSHYIVVLEPAKTLLSTSVQAPGSSDQSAFGDTKYGRFISRQAKGTSLRAYKQASEEQKRTLLDFKPKYIEELENRKGMKFSLYLEKIPNAILEILTLEDVIIPYEYSPLKFADLSDQDLSTLNFESVEKITREQFAFLLKRIPLIPSQDPKFDPNPTLWRFVDLQKADSSLIEKNVKKIESATFAFLRNDQLKGVKLSDLNKEQVSYVFDFCKTDELGARFALFKDEDVAQVVNDGRLLGKMLKHLSDKQLKLLKLSLLSEEQINDLFVSCIDEKGFNEAKRKFGLIENAKEVQTAIEKGTLHTPLHMQFLSDKSWGELKISELSKESIKNAFSDPVHNLDRFKLIQVSEVQAALDAGKLAQPQAELLSDDHLKSLTLSTISRPQFIAMFSDPYNSKSEEEAKRRFSFLKPSDIQEAIEKDFFASPYRFRLLSEKHLQFLKISKLTKDQLDMLFYDYYNANGEALDKQRFSLIAFSEVQAAIDKGLFTRYHFRLLSDEHLKLLRLANIKMTDCFPVESESSIKAEAKRRFAFLQPQEVKRAAEADKLNIYHFELLSLAQTILLKTSDTYRDKIEKQLPNSKVEIPYVTTSLLRNQK